MNKNVKEGPKLNQHDAEKYVLIPFTISLNALISCEHQINKKDVKNHDMGTRFRSVADQLQLIKTKYDSGKTIFLCDLFDDVGKTLKQTLGSELGEFYACVFRSLSTYLSTFSWNQALYDEMWMKTLENIAKELQNKAHWHVVSMFITEIQYRYIKGDKFISAFGKGVEKVQKLQLLDNCGVETYVMGVWLRALYEGLKLNIY